MRYFKGKQFKKDIILVAVGYYCRFSLSYRDVSEILKERGISVHPTTIMRWIHEYGYMNMAIWCIRFGKRKTKRYSYLSVWMKPILKSKENGVIYIVPLTKRGKRLIFNCVKREIHKRHILLWKDWFELIPTVLTTDKAPSLICACKKITEDRLLQKYLSSYNKISQ